jgi:hypothetical protein
MGKTARLGAVLLVLPLALSTVWLEAASAAPGSGSGDRANRWVEVWCDTDTHSADGDTITFETAPEGDDAIGKVLDAKSLDPGNHEGATANYNAVAGVIQRWHCGALRYWDGTIVPAP